jgi:hypothetical protein
MKTRILKKYSRFAVKKLRLQSQLIPTVTQRGRYDINEGTAWALHIIEQKLDTCRELI